MNLPLTRYRRRYRRPLEVSDIAASSQLRGSDRRLVEIGRNRMAVTGLLFAVCFAVLASRLVTVTLFAGDETRRFAQRTGVALTPARRTVSVGRMTITDRNGELLAINLRTASLYANPQDVTDPRRAAARLVRVLPDLGQAMLERRLASPKSFIWLKRNLTPREQDAINRLGIPG